MTWARGPGRHCKKILLGSSAEKERVGLSMNKYHLNLEDFQIEYSNGKIQVIKSYNEDNIHISVKYNVWSSTPDENKKLDAAYRDKIGKTSEAGIVLCRDRTTPASPFWLFYHGQLHLVFCFQLGYLTRHCT